MSNFNLIHGSCANQTTDAVVNAANSGLLAGGGIPSMPLTDEARSLPLINIIVANLNYRQIMQ